MLQPNSIKSKSVGAVRIFEICGKFSGEFADKGNVAMQRVMKTMTLKNVLFNLRELEQIDDRGIDFILDRGRQASKCGLLARDQVLSENFRRRDKEQRISYLGTEEEAVRFFSKEFASGTTEDSNPVLERRHYIRLDTVLPVEFEYECGSGRKLFFSAVVTNLSENGLYAEFIQSRAEDQARVVMDPYDLRLIGLKLIIPPGEIVDMKGKLIHGSVRDGGVGLEFYDFVDGGREKIRSWVETHLNRKIGS